MSRLTEQDWTIYQGETARWTLTMVDADEARQDLTGGTLYFQARTAVDAADPAAVALQTGAGITHAAQLDETLGQATVEITAAQTAALAAGTLVYDVVFVDATAARWVVVPTSKLVVKDPAVTVP